MKNNDTATRVSVWRRLSRGQFGLRALLVLMLAAAVFTWWMMQTPKGFMSEQQASQVKKGMTQAEVISIAGIPPNMISFSPNVSRDDPQYPLEFNVYGGFFRSNQLLTVTNENGRVVKIELRPWY